MINQNNILHYLFVCYWKVRYANVFMQGFGRQVDLLLSDQSKHLLADLISICLISKEN